MDSLKEALEKAGLKGNDKEERPNKSDRANYKLRSAEGQPSNRPSNFRDRNERSDNWSSQSQNQPQRSTNNQGSSYRNERSDNRPNQSDNRPNQSGTSTNNQGSSYRNERSDNRPNQSGASTNNQGSSYRNDRDTSTPSNRYQRDDRSSRLEQDRDERSNRIADDGNYRRRNIPEDAIPKEDRRFLDQEKRPTRPDEGKAKVHTHHLMSVCEACNKTSPDVEYYEHSIRTLKAHWLCIPCADNYNIHDKYRKTAQSDFSLRRCFCRLWGPTMKYIKRETGPILDVENDG